MSTMVMSLVGASSTKLTWDTIQWEAAVAHVRRLQMRIAKAYREGKQGKVKSLQWLLTHSFYAKLLAVKRVTQSQGAKTPGVDNIVWKTSNQKMKAVMCLKRRGYQTKPLKRIYIPKKEKGTFRPLSIPSMQCRAQQALYLLALEPVAEMVVDKNAYGFRPLRSTADAIERCFIIFAKKVSAQYILEGDIKACFDSISKTWLLNNASTDKEMLKKWLAAGYIEKGVLHSTENGVPQGGIISPTLLNIALSGLEDAVHAAVSNPKDKVHLCIYADDFIISGVTKEVLENKVKPAVESFLSERGLSLSQEKTKITHIEEGFDFLGMNIRKYNGKLIIKPAKSSVKRFLTKIREIIKVNRTAKTENLLQLLNPKIQGWANYYRHVCSKRTFSYVRYHIFNALWRWAVRRHPTKGRQWVRKKYFCTDKFRNWVFFAKSADKQGIVNHIELMEICKIPIKRHTKIRSEATPYNPAYHDYLNQWLDKRRGNRQTNTFKRDVSWRNLFNLDRVDKAESLIVA